MFSQDKFSKMRFERFSNLRKVKNLVEAGGKGVYLYGSAAIKEEYDKRLKNSKIPIYHDEYLPDFTEYQYDLEMFIFLNYDSLYRRELELADKEKLEALEAMGLEYGATFFKRQEHLENAILLRWPEKMLPTGEASTAFALTPWAKDFLYGLSNYSNIVQFGGGGQGKTYSPIAFMVMLYDHFIHTKSGAQCSFSTVSETKLKSSIWSHLTKLYSWRNKYTFSKYAGTASVAPEYTYKRRNLAGKYIEEGGTMKGILLVQGAKTARQIDKLTGQHDVMARAYLLDEAQSTGPAPLQAYNNMFLHPRWGWFLMAGNYELDEDLLGINTTPSDGWESVNENTHMWESTLKSPDSDLGHKSLVIHYNNELSPGMTDPAMAKKYAKFLMTPEKKRRLYKSVEEEETYEAKRFWVGFRFEKKKENVEKVLTPEILKEFGAAEKQDFRTLFSVASLDSAHSTERDRSILTIFNVGVDERGYPMIATASVLSLPKPNAALTYYKETANMIKDRLVIHQVELAGYSIMDWTQRSQLLEGLRELGVVFHHMIYQQHPPKEIGMNEVTKTLERPIELETIPTFANGFERDIKTYAHEKIANRITTGAYLFRLFVEKGRCRNINSSILQGVPNVKSFEDEMCQRIFEYTTNHNEPKLKLDDKSIFKRKRRFSPDILDTFYQVFYMLYVNFGIHPDRPGLGSMKKKKVEKVIDNKIWDARLRFRNKPRS